MARVIAFPPRPATEPFLTKQQLAGQLHYSTRWIDLKTSEGMPYHQLGGRRRFRLSEVLEWLEDEDGNS